MKKLNLTEATCKALEGYLNEDYTPIDPDIWEYDLKKLGDDLKLLSNDLKKVIGQDNKYRWDTDQPNLLHTLDNIAGNLDKYSDILISIEEHSNEYLDPDTGDFTKVLV